MVDTRDILQIIRRRFWIILLVPAIAVIATLIITKSKPPIYRASTRMLVNADKTTLTGRDLIYTYATLDQATIIPTFVEIANSERIITQSVASLNLWKQSLDVYSLSAVAIPGASVLELSARGPSPTVVQELANMAGQKMIEYVNQYYQGYTIEVLDSAPLPAMPAEPNPIRNASVALVLGLVLGGFLATASYYLPLLHASVRGGEIFDATSSAYTRTYLKRQIDEVSDVEIQDASLGIIKLNGLNTMQSVLSKNVYNRVLHYAVDQMRYELRGKDIIARWSEDSFAIFTPDLPFEEAKRLLEAISEKLESPQIAPAAGRLVYFDPKLKMVKPMGENASTIRLKIMDADLENPPKNGAKPLEASPQGRKEVR